MALPLPTYQARPALWSFKLSLQLSSMAVDLSVPARSLASGLSSPAGWASKLAPRTELNPLPMPFPHPEKSRIGLPTSSVSVLAHLSSSGWRECPKDKPVVRLQALSGLRHLLPHKARLTHSCNRPRNNHSNPNRSNSNNSNNSSRSLRRCSCSSNPSPATCLQAHLNRGSQGSSSAHLHHQRSFRSTPVRRQIRTNNSSSRRRSRNLACPINLANTIFPPACSSRWLNCSSWSLRVG